MVPTLYISRTADGEGLPLPSYSSAHHIALNLQAAVATPVRLNKDERAYVPVGFAIGIPDGYCGQVVSVPTLAREQGVVVLDGPQILHPADRQPLFILLQNTSHKAVVIHRGLICAQLLIMPAVQVCWKEVQPHLTAAPTATVILDTDANQDEKPALKFSRRKVRSIRNRYKDEDDEDS